MKSLSLLFNLMFALFFAMPTQAADHIDSPFLSETGADIADLFVFPAPGKKEKLVVVLNVRSGVTPGGAFSHDSRFKISIQTLNENPQNLTDFLKTQPALEIDCEFKKEGVRVGGVLLHGFNGRVCNFTRFNESTPKTVSIAGLGKSNVAYYELGIETFTGTRADPFYISIPAFDQVVRRKGNFHDFRREAGSDVNNGILNVNVLSLIFEIDMPKNGLSPGLYAIAAQSYFGDGEGQYEIIDRAGRPEFINVGLHDYTNKKSHISGGSYPVKRDFNTSEIFETPLNGNEIYEERFKDNVSNYDLLGDDKIDLNEQQLNSLATLFVNDFLIINTSESCMESGTDFLSIEREIVLSDNFNVESCGGRHMNDNIFAATYGLFIGGLNADRSLYQTAITTPYQGFETKRDISDRFPYLPGPVKFDISEAFNGFWLYKQTLEW